MSDAKPTTTALEARHRLEAGNRAFVESGDVGDRPGTTPAQEPFAAVIGCADARAPVELLFGQGWNDVFVMKVAGNGLNAENLGSMQYAAVHVPTVKVAAVLGHTSCGAVTVTVDAWLDPSNYPTIVPTPQLRTIVQGGLIAVRAACEFLEGVHGAEVVERHGYRAALIETTVAIHAATTARVLRDQIAPLNPDLEIVFGVYDIASRRVGLTADEPGLTEAPATADAFDAIGFRVAESAMISRLLDG